MVKTGDQKMLKRISVYAAVIAAGGLMYMPIIANAKEGGQRGAVFEKIDADSDGQITKTELEAMGAARFARLDTDGDGFITQCATPKQILGQICRMQMFCAAMPKAMDKPLIYSRNG
jgi:hypothetical protein